MPIDKDRTSELSRMAGSGCAALIVLGAMLTMLVAVAALLRLLFWLLGM